MTTSVVVVCHRLHRWLEECLLSVLNQADEVVVVDNGSPDRAAAMTATRLGAKVVRLDANVGFPAGVNAGMRAARGDVLALLNDDAMATPSWLRLSAQVLEDENVAAVAPKLLFAWPHAEVRLTDEPTFVSGDPRPLGRCLRSVSLDGVEILARLLGPGIHRLEEGIQGAQWVQWRWTAGREPIHVPLPPGSDPGSLRFDGEPVEVARVVDVLNNAGSYLSAEGHGGDYGFGAADDGTFDEPADRFAACGAAMVMRAETFSRVGPFASDFFAYYEDTDWCWRAQLADFRISYEPKAVVRHVGGVTTGGPMNPRVAFFAARNRLLCLARNAPMSVVGVQLWRTAKGPRPPRVRRALGKRIPRALIDRRVLARKWIQAPSDVWSRWAGVGEIWGAQRRSDEAVTSEKSED